MKWWRALKAELDDMTAGEKAVVLATFIAMFVVTSWLMHVFS